MILSMVELCFGNELFFEGDDVGFYCFWDLLFMMCWGISLIIVFDCFEMVEKIVLSLIEFIFFRRFVWMK